MRFSWGRELISNSRLWRRLRTASKRLWKVSGVTRTALRYGLPFVSIVGALCLQGALQHILPKGHDFPYAFLYLLAAFVSAWYGGYGPGTLACLITMVGLPLAAVHSSSVPPIGVSKLLVFIGVSLLISKVAETQRRAREVLHSANDELDRRVLARNSDLRYAAEELQQHKALLQTTFDSIDDGIIVSNEHGEFLLFNPAAQRILQKSSQKSDPKKWSDLYSLLLPDGITPFPVDELPLMRAIRGEATDDVLMLARSGNPAQEKWLSVSGRPLRHPDGCLRGGLAAFRDVTARKQALEELAQSEERLRLTLGSSGIGVWSWDIAPDVIEADENCHGLFGVPIGRFPQTIEGFSAILHPDDRGRVHQEVFASVGHAAGYHTEFRAVWSDDTVRVLAVRGKVYYDNGGRPSRLTSVCWDVTIRRQAEESLRKSEEQYRLLFEGNPQPMWVYDVATLEFLAVNDAAIAKYGYTRDEFLKMDIKQVRPLEDLDMLEKDLAQRADTLQHSKGWRHVTKQGDVIDVETVAHELVYGGVAARLVLINDVTEQLRIEAHASRVGEENVELTKAVAVAQERARVEEQIMNLNRRLEYSTAEAQAANQAKSTFLSTMSHEIRTPMNAILGYAQLMLRDPSLGSDARANLKIIGRSGEHLLTLINEVLDLAKIESGRTELKPVTFDLFRLFDDLAAMFRLRAEAKALRFEMVVDGESVLYVSADEGKIRQSLINLLGNAIKFTARGLVKLHVVLEQRNPNQLWLSARVEDTGPGMTDEEQRQLFERFSQTKRGLHSQEGTGLGLAISRNFARLMGGDITVTSNCGTGSIFLFEVPIERGESGVAIRESSPRRVMGIRAGSIIPRILVVDDQFENRDWIMKLLTSLGFSVRGADQGEAAVRNWEEWRPQLILMDMHMPIMDGLEATQRIKSDPRGKETFVVVLTASAMDGDRRIASQSRADDFLTKPCREDELLEKIRTLLNIVYDYEEPNQPPEGQPLTAVAALSTAGLGQLPREVLGELRDATLDGNKKLLDRLILKVGETEDAGVAKALQELADKYEYDALARVLEEACCR